MPRQAFCLQADNGFCRACEADLWTSSQAASLYPAYMMQCIASYMQEYRSGHNEAVLKTVCLTARGFESLFLRQIKWVVLQRECYPFYFVWNNMRDSNRSVKKNIRGMFFSGDRRILQDIYKKYALLVLQNSRGESLFCVFSWRRQRRLRFFHFLLLDFLFAFFWLPCFFCHIFSIDTEYYNMIK